MRLWLMLGMVASLAGCPANIRPCAEGTVFVTVELVGTAAQADTLVVELAIDGGPTRTTSLSHTTAVAKGGVQIEFPQGYPQGHTLAITITATQGGVPFATRSVSVVLDGGCEAISLQLGMVAPDLLTPAIVDLLGADGATGADGAILDLSIASDLTTPQGDGGSLDDLPADGFVPPADLTCVGTVEDCFNGVDDDCDGMADCADFECTGGGSPKAECIPDPGKPTYGTKVAGTGACPPAYPSGKPRNAGFVDSTCNLGTCNASGTLTYACEVGLTDYSGTVCGGAFVNIFVNSTQGCTGITPIAAGHRTFLSEQPQAIYMSGTCPTPTGAASKTSAKFNSNDKYCERSSVGVGCAASQICVPKASNYCYDATGALGSCVTGYTLDAPYATGINEQKSCGCSGGSFPGVCSQNDWGLHQQPSCSDGRVAVPFATCDATDYSSYVAIEIGAPTSQGSCFTTTLASGSDTPTGTYQLCCR